MVNERKSLEEIQIEIVAKLVRLNERLDKLEQFLNGTVLRDKTVSKAGKTSAVIFVPKFFLGQKVKVAIAPENTEVLGLRKTIDKKMNKITKLINENKKLKSGEMEKVDAADKANETDEVEVKDTENLEDDDAY